MKTTTKWFVQTLVIILIICCIQVCSDEESPGFESSNDYGLKLYQPPLTTASADVILQGQSKNKVTGEEILYFGTYKDSNGEMVPDQLRAMLIRKAANDSAVVQIFDNQGGMIIYGVNRITNTKNNLINEFEKIDELNFYYRIWDYDWLTENGNCLYTSKVTKGVGGFTVENIFTNGKTNKGTLEKINHLKSTMKNSNFDPSFSYVVSGRINTSGDFTDAFQSEIQSTINAVGSTIKEALTDYAPTVGKTAFIVGLVVVSEPLIVAGAAMYFAGKIGGPIINYMLDAYNSNNNTFENTDLSITTDQGLSGEVNLSDTYAEAGINTSSYSLNQPNTNPCNVTVWFEDGYVYVNGGTPPYTWAYYIDGVYYSSLDFSSPCKAGAEYNYKATDVNNCTGGELWRCPG